LTCFSNISITVKFGNKIGYGDFGFARTSMMPGVETIYTKKDQIFL
jgi:hypothetical protein